MIGETISHYKITGRLGAGGMGEVYLAEDTKLDRRVALKFLPTTVWNEAEAQARLIREAKAASQLDHPNVVTIYGIEESEGRPFIIMAHVRGMTLGEYCSSEKRTADELLELALQMADGLQHAHEAGVIHRDLKPGNIIVDDRGRVRILDFGIASLRGAAKLTQTGTTVGTLAYAPPELAMGTEAGPSSDVYSLGVVMYQMLTGQLPFEADHEAALLYSILNESPKPFSDAATDVPAALQKLIMRCLEKQPENRFASCVELMAELRQCRPQAASASSDQAAPDKPSIAVLPFANMSADPENEYFSDGLSEELMNVLAKNPALKVTGRTSSFAFKGKHEDLRDIGQKLGVETLLEGSVRKAGNRVRITTQLVKVTDGFHLWSETYDRVLDDIFAVQDDIAEAVATAMNVTLLGHVVPKTKVNSESYNLVLRANYFANQNTEESLRTAIALYEKAIEIDSKDARAWGGLASAYGYSGGYGYTDVAEAHQIMKTASENALKLDGNCVEAHEMLGWVYLNRDHDWKKAREAFQRAYQLAPNNSGMQSSYAMFLAFCGEMDEARKLAERAVEVDPLNPMSHMWRGRIELGTLRLDGAMEFYDRAIELSPGITSGHSIRAFVYLLQGRLDDAVAECEKEKTSGYRLCTLAMIEHARGNAAASDAALNALLREGEQWGVQFACVYAYRNEKDAAFKWLERSLALNDSGISPLRTQPAFANLHNDPRWLEFLRKAGMPV